MRYCTMDNQDGDVFWLYSIICGFDQRGKGQREHKLNKVKNKGYIYSPNVYPVFLYYLKINVDFYLKII